MTPVTLPPDRATQAVNQGKPVAVRSRGVERNPGVQVSVQVFTTGHVEVTDPMPDGFSVDLAALRQAAEGVTDTLNALATKKVSDIDADKSAFGHDALGGTVSDFCERWEIGVEHLAKDGQEVADRLATSVNAYTHVERVTHANMQGILQQSTGPDPAAR